MLFSWTLILIDSCVLTSYPENLLNIFISNMHTDIFGSSIYVTVSYANKNALILSLQTLLPLIYLSYFISVVRTPRTMVNASDDGWCSFFFFFPQSQKKIFQYFTIKYVCCKVLFHILFISVKKCSSILELCRFALVYFSRKF